MFSKWMLYAAVVLAYTIGVAHITSTYVNNSWTAKELKRTEEFLAIQSLNSQLKQEISKLLQDNLARSAIKNKQFTKELLDEIAKDPLYKSCRTTDGVRGALQRKLDSQPE